MASLPLAPHCTEVDGPPCHRLLDDPEGVTADRTQWPDHICDGVARASTVAWAQEHAGRLVGKPLPVEVVEWTRMSPLPVGSWARPHTLFAAFPLLAGRMFDPGLVDGRLAVLATTEKAALILTPDIPFAQVAAFGIVDDHPFVREESGGAFDVLPVTMQFVTTGWGNDRVDAFRKQASNWWGQLAGIPATGRRAGRTHSRADVVAAYHEFHAAYGWRPKQTEVAAMLNITPRSVRTYIGQNWADFVRDIGPSKLDRVSFPCFPPAQEPTI